MIENDNIYLMDCLEGMRQMSRCSVDLVVTSPPYDNMRTYGHLDEEGFTFEIFKPIAKELSEVLKDGGIIVWNVNDATIDGSETGTSFRQALYFMEECKLNLLDTMIWEKTSNGCLGSSNCYLQNFEYMFVFCKGKPKAFNPIKDRPNKIKSGKVTVNGGLVDGKGENRVVERKPFGIRTNIWQINPQQNSFHSAPFPIDLARCHIISWSNEGDVVLDPFMGSATTAVACHMEHRHFIGFELNESYYNEALKRLNRERQQLTLF